MTTTLQDLIDDSIFISTEYQARLAEISNGAEWTVDFSAPSFTLQSDASVSLTPYLLGTESESRASWIWSWQELGHFPHQVVSAAIQAREGGAEQSIQELTTDELPLDSGLARKLTLAAKTLTGIYAHYPVTAGAGVRAWILLEGPELELGAPTVNRMGQVMAQALQTGTAINHLRAVNSYAQLRGAHIAWDTEATAVITASDGALRLWFDQGKISGIEAAEPSVDEQELARLASQASAQRQDLAAARRLIETLAQEEADRQLAARLAQAEAEAEKAEAAAAAQAQAEAQAEEAQEAEADQAVSEEAASSDSDQEVAGTVTTDRVYTRLEEPYDQAPSAPSRPGRVTTSTIPQEEILSAAQEETPVAEASADQAQQAEAGAESDSPQAEAAQAESAQPEAPQPIRLAGQAPNLEAERAEAAQKPQPKEEKKGFFSRFFGL
ncbi:MAG: hydrolase [Rothia sp. (in: high G+C Gram-positive bacteria)]|nr:hydrolase [Rothia sp. (in: high G+C Gram-positive bacteria)]